VNGDQKSLVLSSWRSKCRPLAMIVFPLWFLSVVLILNTLKDWSILSFTVYTDIYTSNFTFVIKKLNYGIFELHKLLKVCRIASQKKLDYSRP
jgi:hypothetical protein